MAEKSTLKKSKVLVFDLGNTTIHFGIFSGGRLIKDWRLATAELRTLKKLDLPAADFVAGCSVVPQLDQKLTHLIRPKPLFINYQNIPYIKVATDHPAEVGADRLVNALAVYKKYQKDTIIIDIGTAITIDLVSQKGAYLGGIIFPGLNLCAQVLAAKTAKLPLVKIKKPKNLIGQNTADSIRSGLYFGLTSMINCLVSQIKKKYEGKFLVVATGGDLKQLSQQITRIDVKNNFLTLEGLYQISRILDRQF